MALVPSLSTDLHLHDRPKPSLPPPQWPSPILSKFLLPRQHRSPLLLLQPNPKPSSFLLSSFVLPRNFTFSCVLSRSSVCSINSIVNMTHCFEWQVSEDGLTACKRKRLRPPGRQPPDPSTLALSPSQGHMCKPERRLEPVALGRPRSQGPLGSGPIA